MPGAQYVPLKPGTAFVVHAGRFVNTGGPDCQVIKLVECSEIIPLPVAKTQYSFPSLTIVEGSWAERFPCSSIGAAESESSIINSSTVRKTSCMDRVITCPAPFVELIFQLQQAQRLPNHQEPPQPFPVCP